MRTRIDIIDYYDATAAQRADVDAYLAELGRPRDAYSVTAVEATAEGTVRLERLAGPYRAAYVFHLDPPCGLCGRSSMLGWVGVRETLRPALPPPWLAWPDPEEGDADA